jgi:hypothetical protein
VGELECMNYNWSPLDFSRIFGAPNKRYYEDLLDLIGLFHGYCKSSLLHIVSSIEVMNESHIVYEDVCIHMFLCTFEKKSIDWFYYLGEEPITTFP